MCGSSSSFRAGSSWTLRAATSFHSVPAGEKKGSVRKMMPSISRMAVAVPICVMLTLFLNVEADMFQCLYLDAIWRGNCR